MRMTKVCLGLLLLTLFPMNIVAQSKVTATIYKQVVEQMISVGEIKRSCLKEAGGYDELVFVDYENYNEDRVPEVIVVQKAGCISAGMSYIWIYRKTRKGYQKIYGPISGDALKQKTKTNGYYDVAAVERAGFDKYASTIYRFDGQRYRSNFSAPQTPVPPRASSGTSIRRIDFKNHTYDSSEVKVRVRNGKWKGRFPGEYFSVDKIVYGDVTGDGQEEAVVVTSSSGGGSGNFSGATVYSLKNNLLIELSVYPGDGYGPYNGLPGGDRGNGSIHDVKIQNGQLLLEKYAPSDSLDAPQYVAVYIDTYIFRWSGSSLISDGKRKQRRLK